MTAVPTAHRAATVRQRTVAATLLLAAVLLAALVLADVPAPAHASTPAQPTIGGAWRHSAQPGPSDSYRPEHDVWVPVGSLSPLLVQASPPGTRFALQPGIHRLTAPLRLKAGQQLLGQPGATLSGARIITGWTRTGSRWYAQEQVRRLPRLLHPGYDVEICRPEAPLCQHAEEVFLDDEPLERVSTRAAVGPGRYHIDDANRIFLGDDPAGRTVEVSVAEQAIFGAGADVVVRNLVIEKFGNRAQLGTLHDGWQPGWTVEHNEIRLNHGVGVQMYGGVLRRNVITRNGQLGVGGGGQGLLVERNEISFNNTRGYNPYWEAGGGKWAFARQLTVRGNFSQGNGGQGLWTDLGSRDVTFEGNIVEGNDMAGIMHEVSGAAVIRGNIAMGNGGRIGWYQEGAGILVYNSHDVNVYGNTVSDNAAGVAIRHDARSSATRHISVRQNYIAMSRGRTGLVDTTEGPTGAEPGSIVFDANTYAVPSRGARWFEWEDQAGRTFLQWQSSGHDATGRLDAAAAVGRDGDAAVPNPLSDSWTAADGAAWSTAIWPRSSGLAGSRHDVVGGEGRMTTGGSVPYAWSLAEPAGGERADGEIVVRMTRRDGASEGYVDVWQRADDNHGDHPANGYKVEAAWDGTRARLYLKEVTDGASRWLGTLRPEPAAGQAFFVRFRVEGATIAARAWLEGHPEPLSWDAEVTDHRHARGTRRLRVLGGGVPADVDVRFDDYWDRAL